MTEDLRYVTWIILCWGDSIERGKSKKRVDCSPYLWSYITFIVNEDGRCVLLRFTIDVPLKCSMHHS